MTARTWRVVAWTVAVAAAIAALVAVLAVAAGVYNVGATSEHFSVTDRLIKFALRRSVAVRSGGIEVPDLNDPRLIELGSEHFRFGCAPCHGTPNRRQNPLVERMYPAPPRLLDAVSDWTSAELFWIVKHGLKFTGMPAWPGEERDDEIWPIVAYLNTLGDDAEVEAQQAPQGRPDVPLADLGSAGGGNCARCHGDADTAPTSDIVPSLHGQNTRYLIRALREYSDGTRESGMMEPIAAGLNSAEIDRLADRYASLAPPPRAAHGDLGGDSRRGREIAKRGIPADGIPPCLACHSGRASPNFPKLGELSAQYVKLQLDLWRRGYRRNTAYGEIMATIARRLDDRQIDDVAAYLATLPRTGDDEAPAPGLVDD